MMKRYQAVIRPYGVPEEWVLQELEGSNDTERAIEINTYLKGIGVEYFTVIHYGRRLVVDIAIDDINLN